MHFGMVAFDLFYDMYLEEIENVNKNGWPEKPSCEKDILIPASIIQNNLYGIDIDLRAIQLSALALYLKAKSKCKEITIERYNLVHTDIPAFSDESINEFVDSLSPKYELTKKLFKIVMPELAKAYYLGSLLKLEDIINSFLEKQYTILSKKFGKQMHFGFAIEKEQEEILFKKELVWSEIKEELRDALNEFIEKANGNTDSFMAQETKKGVYLVDTLMRKYDVVVTNPPFSSQRNMNQILRKNLKLLYENKFQDFYTCFIARALELVLKNGFVGMITLHSFMFTSSFQNIREEITLKKRLETLAHLGPTFMDLSNPFAQQCVMFVVSNNNLSKSKVPCFRLVDFLYKKKEIRFLECVNNYFASKAEKWLAKWFGWGKKYDMLILDEILHLVENNLIAEKELLILDEPATGIDMAGEQTIYDLIEKINRERNTTCVIVSHELNIVSKYAKKVLCLNKNMICYGKPEKVINKDTLQEMYGLGVALYHSH
jgi:hypothetical protein